MATKQFRKYISDIKRCERIEVFIDPDMSPDSHSRWLHFIDRKRKFIGIDFAYPRDPLDAFVSEEIEFIVRHGRAQASDPNLCVTRRFHVKNYKRDGTIVRKNGKWTWIK